MRQGRHDGEDGGIRFWNPSQLAVFQAQNETRDGVCVNWCGDGQEDPYQAVQMRKTNKCQNDTKIAGFLQEGVGFAKDSALWYALANKNMMEQTLVLVKPDGVQRGLIGTIIGRLERVGLKVVAMKMLQPTREQADKHYALTEEWMMAVYTKAKTKMEANGEPFPYPDHISYGTSIKNGLVTFLASAPVVAVVFEGEQAVSMTRKVVGATEPASAVPGTIRGDYSLDTYALSNAQNRPIRNLIHASGTLDEAKFEIPLWFAASEILKINAALDPIQYDEKRFV